ncbi:MAG: glycosyltransferase family 2 protein [Clostridium sp.]|uniref:glycosyltransferase family 2 protein n=1 Tax=Clostridium sp. TaxID=1506 RepID=UPI003F330B09
MSEKVSVVVPCYNGEKFIKRCLDSILNQTYNNIELVIVNDGSKDNSERLILSYEKVFISNGFEFRYIKKPNGGVGSAMKVGLENITGDYFMTLDVDDYILNTAVEKMANYLSERNYNLVRCNGYYVDEENIHCKDKLFINKEEKENIFEDLIYARTNNWAGSYMVRRKEFLKVTSNIEFLESRHGQNLQILLPISYENKAGFIKEPLVKYVKCSGSYTDVKTLDDTIQMYDNFKNIRFEILKRMNILDDKIFKSLEVEYLRTYLGLCLLYGDKKKGKVIYKNIKKTSELNKSDFRTYLCLKYSSIYKIQKLISGNKG